MSVDCGWSLTSLRRAVLCWRRDRKLSEHQIARHRHFNYNSFSSFYLLPVELEGAKVSRTSCTAVPCSLDYEHQLLTIVLSQRYALLTQTVDMCQDIRAISTQNTLWLRCIHGNEVSCWRIPQVVSEIVPCYITVLTSGMQGKVLQSILCVSPSLIVYSCETTPDMTDFFSTGEQQWTRQHDIIETAKARAGSTWESLVRWRQYVCLQDSPVFSIINCGRHMEPQTRHLLPDDLDTHPVLDSSQSTAFSLWFFTSLCLLTGTVCSVLLVWKCWATNARELFSMGDCFAKSHTPVLAVCMNHSSWENDITILWEFAGTTTIRGWAKIISICTTITHVATPYSVNIYPSQVPRTMFTHCQLDVRSRNWFFLCSIKSHNEVSILSDARYCSHKPFFKLLI